MKVSFITTVFNEEQTIAKLLDSLIIQTKFPQEIVIFDGVSIDKTRNIIKSYANKFQQKGIGFKLITKKGNRSVGRNEAINKAGGDIIVCSDAGCELDKDWVKKIVEPFEDPLVDVVAGYYKGKSGNVFQKCLVPYVLVMPDKVDPDNFLPAARSIAFRKEVWKSAGGFLEKFYNNEDYVFAKKLKSIKANIIFQKDAIAYWIPRKNLREAFIMFFRFAKGDCEAGIFRSKVLFLFTRYLIGLFIFIWKIEALLLLLIVYLLWSIAKNYKYVNDLRAVIILPVLQITADMAVMTGTIIGGFKVWDIKKM